MAAARQHEVADSKALDRDLAARRGDRGAVAKAGDRAAGCGQKCKRGAAAGIGAEHDAAGGEIKGGVDAQHQAARPVGDTQPVAGLDRSLGGGRRDGAQRDGAAIAEALEHGAWRIGTVDDQYRLGVAGEADRAGAGGTGPAEAQCRAVL